MKIRISLRRKKPRIAILNISGVIEEHSDDQSPRHIAEALEAVQHKRPQALIVRLNTPGGTVGATQEIYQSLVRFREETHIPVVASMGDLAASGGLYVAMAADKVVANAGTVTGSIGVVIQSRNVSRLLSKVGVSAQVVKSGRYKDTLSVYRGLTRSERTLLQSVIDDSHDQFVEVVARGRQLSPQAMRKVGDGRVMTGRQAKNLGLVDALGGFEQAVAVAKELAGITVRPQLFELLKVRRPWWARLSRRFFRRWGTVMPINALVGTAALPGGIPLYAMPM